MVLVRGVHQVLAGAVPYDAITRHALAAREVIRGMGLRSEILCEADHIDGTLAGEILPDAAWDRIAEPGDVAILHYSIASPAFDRVLERSGSAAIHYHNITPAELLWRFAPAIAQECAAGRRRLAELADRVGHAAADSAFNADELTALGFPDHGRRRRGTPATAAPPGSCSWGGASRTRRSATWCWPSPRCGTRRSTRS